MVILEATLPGRSGIDVLRHLGRGLRYHDCLKFLISPSLPMGGAAELDRVENLKVLDLDEIPFDLPSLLSGNRKKAQFDRLRIEHQARVALYQGLSAHEEGDLPAAIAHLAEALRFDPLLAEAHRWMARIQYALGSLGMAATAFGLAHDLGERHPDDTAHLASIHQMRGNFRVAARLWHTAAVHWDDAEVSASLRTHGEALLNPFVEVDLVPEGGLD